MKKTISTVNTLKLLYFQWMSTPSITSGSTALTTSLKENILSIQDLAENLKHLFKTNTFKTEKIAEAYSPIPLPSDVFKGSLNPEEIDQTLTEEEKRID